MSSGLPTARRSVLCGTLAQGSGLVLILALCLALTSPIARAELDVAALQQRLATRFGTPRVPLLDEWLAVLGSAKALPEDAKLERINDFINRRIVFDNDIAVWQQDDYWATPLETIGKGRGDCEDFSIIKYVSLRLTGVPSGKLRLVYARARLQTPSGPVEQAHMVLAYYATPDAEPLILDNLDGTIRPAFRRRDLQPVFSFNSDGIFVGISGSGTAAAGNGRLSRWEDAWRRILADGFE